MIMNGQQSKPSWSRLCGLVNACGEEAAARFRDSSSIGGKEQRVAPSVDETKGNGGDGGGKAVCSITQELSYDNLRAMAFFHEDPLS